MRSLPDEDVGGPAVGRHDANDPANLDPTSARLIDVKNPALGRVFLDQLSKKLLSFLDRLGCLSFLSALASI